MSIESDRWKRQTEEAEEKDRQRMASTIQESELPCPRLELRWEKIGNDLFCNYNFVMPIDTSDVREGSAVQVGSELRFTMSWTRSRGERAGFPMAGGVISAPWQDGYHAAWDSYRLGFPAYVVWQEQAQLVAPKKPTGEPIKEEPPLTEADEDWVQGTFEQLLSDFRGQLRRFRFKVSNLEDRQPDSMYRTYLGDFVEFIEGQIRNLDDHFYGFRGWIEQRSFRSRLKTAHLVCRECGMEVPDDLTEACEHVLDEHSRRFLK